jgi:hypothetical protein
MITFPTMHGGMQLGVDRMPFRLFDIGVDVDEVLHPWGATVHELCRAAGLHDHETNTYVWKMWEAYGCTEEQWHEVVTKATIEGGLYDVAPIPGSLEALRRLSFLGHRIHLVTARGFFDNGDLIRQHTHEWVAEYAVPHQSLEFSKDKAEVANRLGLDYFIDDGVHNFQELETGAPQCQTYLLTAPHNRDFYTPFRLETMDEFAEIVIEAGEKRP